MRLIAIAALTLISQLQSTTAQGENLNPSAAKSMEFKEEAKPTRGPASIKPAEILPYKEVNDGQTEAGYCLLCESAGVARASTLPEQGREILEHANRAASGK